MPNFKGFSLIEKVILFLIIFEIFYTGFEALIRPVAAWDGWAVWLFKSKIFFLERGINLEIFTRENIGGGDYPLLIPLSGTWIYLVLGRIDDRLVLSLFWAFYLVTILIFYSGVRNFLGRRWTLFFTFLLASIPVLIRHGGREMAGYADLPLAFFILASFITLERFFQNGKIRDLILPSILLGMAGWTKLEGLHFVAFAYLLIFSWAFLNKHRFKFDFKQCLRFLIPIFFTSIFIFPWILFRKKLVENLGHFYAFYAPHTFFFWERWQQILGQYLKEMGKVFYWNLFWPAFFLVILGNLRTLLKPQVLPLFLLWSSQLFYYFIIFLLPNPSVNIDLFLTATDRLLLKVAPLGMYLIVKVLKYSKTI